MRTLQNLPPNPGLEWLQGIYELTFSRRKTWIDQAKKLTRIVDFLGPKRKPIDVFRPDVVELLGWLKEKYHLKDTTVGAYRESGFLFWQWMEDNYLIGPGSNPFYKGETRTYSYTGPVRP